MGMFQTLQARDKVESTGIGLAIVRKIVESRGGRAWVESDGKSGATFRFTWPRRKRRRAPCSGRACRAVRERAAGEGLGDEVLSSRASASGIPRRSPRPRGH